MGDFKESLLGCCDNMYSCFCVTFMPCGIACIQGQAVAMINPEGGSCVPCYLNLYLCCIGATINRNKIREKANYETKICLDIIINLFCMPCAVCQEFRETWNMTKSNTGDAFGKAVEAMQNAHQESDPLNPK